MIDFFLNYEWQVNAIGFTLMILAFLLKKDLMGILAYGLVFFSVMINGMVKGF